MPKPNRFTALRLAQCAALALGASLLGGCESTNAINAGHEYQDERRENRFDRRDDVRDDREDRRDVQR